MYTKEEEESFWAQVDRTNRGGCQPWVGPLFSTGYGRVTIRGRRQLAHRIAYQMANGVPILPKLVVRHSCDNPPCCSPRHLLMGTQKQNCKDTATRGRSTWGERNPASLLTEAQILEIRAHWAKGETSQRKLGEQYGVSQQQISAVVTGACWAELPGAVAINLHSRGLPGSKNNHALMTEEKVRKLRQLYRSGISQPELRAMFNIHQSTVSSICTGRSWKHVTD